MSKLKCAQITFETTGTKYIVGVDDAHVLQNDIACSELGEKWEIEIIEMDENEYRNLPEFEEH